LTLALPVAAAPARAGVTRGDVTAAFQARTTGGYVNMLKGHTVAAPVRGLVDGRISSFADGTYCSTDWHYIAVTLLGQSGHAAAVAYLRQTAVSFALDGAAVSPLMQTAIKPFVGTGIKGQWGISRGALIAPGRLSDGDHSLDTTIVTPDGGTETLSVTFSLLPEACS
ncbi:MAG TPA: hypothetical protein VGM28_05635, partial [Candidatus Limnocylindrales bacterium]